MIHLRADVAAVRATASGSQHRTIKAISQRIARSLSVPTPNNSATYRMGAASVSIRRPWAATVARSALRLARAPAALSRSPSEGRTRLALAFHDRYGGVGLGDGGADLPDLSIKICHPACPPRSWQPRRHPARYTSHAKRRIGGALRRLSLAVVAVVGRRGGLACHCSPVAGSVQWTCRFTFDRKAGIQNDASGRLSSRCVFSLDRWHSGLERSHEFVNPPPALLPAFPVSR